MPRMKPEEWTEAVCGCSDGTVKYMALIKEAERARNSEARLIEALKGAARSLETLSRHDDPYLQDLLQVRGYASNRASMVRAALKGAE